MYRKTALLQDGDCTLRHPAAAEDGPAAEDNRRETEKETTTTGIEGSNRYRGQQQV